MDNIAEIEPIPGYTTVGIADIEADSQVRFLMDPEGRVVVGKIYARLTDLLGKAPGSEVIMKYGDEVERARQWVAAWRPKTIELPNNAQCELTISILGQGELTGDIKGTPTTLGQPRIRGVGLHEIDIATAQLRRDGVLDLDGVLELPGKIQAEVRSAHREISKYLGRKLTFNPANVRIDAHSGKPIRIDAIFTDISADLYNDYKDTVAVPRQ